MQFLGVTSSYVQAYSWLSFRSLLASLGDHAQDRNQVSHVEGKHPTCYGTTLVPLRFGFCFEATPTGAQGLLLVEFGVHMGVRD